MYNQWNNGYCMSTVTKRRCLLKNKKGDSCTKHYINFNYNPETLNKIRMNDLKLLGDQSIINTALDEFKQKPLFQKMDDVINDYNKQLNTKYDHTLLGIYNTWDEIPPIYHIMIDCELWDIRIMVDNISQGLNSCNMENPFPTYPRNPFTRAPLHPETIKKIKDKIIHLKLPINIATKVFLSLPDKSINILYKEALVRSPNVSESLLAVLYKALRFRLTNNRDSQENYIGIWTKCSSPLSDFEILITEWKNVPYQIYDNNAIMINPYKIYLTDVIDSMPDEDVDINKEKGYM